MSAQFIPDIAPNTDENQEAHNDNNQLHGILTGEHGNIDAQVVSAVSQSNGCYRVSLRTEKSEKKRGLLFNSCFIYILKWLNFVVCQYMIKPPYADKDRRKSKQAY